MDYGTAVNRHMINQADVWSDAALAANHGAHYRYELQQFVREGFLDTANAVRQGMAGPFELSDAVAKLNARAAWRTLWHRDRLAFEPIPCS